MLTKEKVAEILEQVRANPNIPYSKLGPQLGISPALMGYHVKRSGIPRRPKKQADNLQAVRSEINELRAKLDQLVVLERQLQVYFELDGKDHILVYGLTPEPISAHWKQWMNFLNGNGAGKLRDFIQEKFGVRPNGEVK